MFRNLYLYFTYLANGGWQKIPLPIVSSNTVMPQTITKVAMLSFLTIASWGRFMKVSTQATVISLMIARNKR